MSSITATRNRVISALKAEVGTKEIPAGSNKVKYNTWYYGKEVSGDDYPWCLVFAQWIYRQVGIKLPSLTASCTAMMNAAKSQGLWLTDPKKFQPGDLLILDVQNKGRPNHCGVLIKMEGTNARTIEGNTGSGNEANGGMVMERVRTPKQVIGAVVPIFGEEDELNMTVAQFVDALTEEQAYKLLTKAMNYADKRPEPSWSKLEGHWKKAIDKKVVEGQPEGLLRKDQMVAILGRAGLL